MTQTTTMRPPQHNGAPGMAPGRMHGMTPSPLAPPVRPAVLPLMRPEHGRMLCGVCLGIAKHLGIKVWPVRLAFLASTFLFGSGLIAYLFLWIFVPSGDPVRAAAALARDVPVADSPLSHGNRPYAAAQGRATQSNAAKPPADGTDTGSATAHESASNDAMHDAADDIRGSAESLLAALRRAPKSSLFALAGLLILAIGVLLAATGLAVGILAATLISLAGIGISWLRYNAENGQLRSMIIGIAMQFLAFTTYIVSSAHMNSSPANAGNPDIRMVLLAGLAMLVGTGIAIVPWMHSLIRDVGTERALKEREEERADMTAHLHDGVLQTLALIQLHSEEPTTVFTLARQQERELRDWLYQERTPPERSVSRGLSDIAAQVEDEHGKPIEVVTVGDALPSAQTDALLDASRQALVNAATHGGEPISVYCEAGKGTVEVYVRDHGSGFDADTVPANRLGIRESIVGRITRRGGTVEIVSKPNWGTEVRMHMPVTCVGDGDGKADETAENAHDSADGGAAADKPHSNDAGGGKPHSTSDDANNKEQR
jgi:signal transduction histidine kinase/phage shock protein PspC (stress-responsive transcriptional regulator)